VRMAHFQFLNYLIKCLRIMHYAQPEQVQKIERVG